MNFKRIGRFLALLAIVLTSCSDDCDLNHESTQLGLPAIIQGSHPNGDINLSVGDSYLFAPQVINQEDVYYQWYLNDEDMGTAKQYQIEANKPMRSHLVLELTNDFGQVIMENDIIVPGADNTGKYFILNEGWFGHEPGNITVLNPEDNSLEQWAFKIQNFGSTLGVTSQSATLWKDKLYICSKEDNQLTVVDPKTLYVEKQTGKLLGNRQAYEFIGINDKYGVITANGDLYRVDLNTLETALISMNDGYRGTGSGIVYENKLILNVSGRKLHVLDLEDISGDLSQYSFNFPYETLDVQTNGGCRFVKGEDGNLYTIESSSTGNSLVKIKPNNLIERSDLRSDYSPSSFGAYREATFCGSANGESFFYIAGGKIYKCTFEDAAPKTPFINFSRDGYSFYGAGIRVNPYNDEIVATYTTSDYKSNLIVRFNGKTGEKIAEVAYEGYYFPATILFVE